MLDRTKSFGVIFGHSWARYEQGGTLYDGAGKSYDEQSDLEEIIKEKGYFDPKSTLENAREFLQRILKEGPMSRNEINKEAETQGIQWSSIKNAATEMKVSSYKIRDVIYWKLPME